MRELLHVFNGIDGETGGYLQPPMTLREVAGLAGGEQRDAGFAAALRRWVQWISFPHAGPEEGIDAKDLSQTGWGVIFARSAGDEVREALSELLEHRRRQATARRERYYREFRGEDGYRPGEEKWDFLNRHDAGFGPADPDHVPYYLLLVGDPEAIPFGFQYQLDVEYAVGRLYFETPEEYAVYAHNVVAAETAAELLAPRAEFFGVRNADDVATQQSADFLVEPLAAMVERRHPDWRVGLWLEADATKERLAGFLDGSDPPALLFTASHGLAFPKASPRQLPHQGALLCQDWPGPRSWKQDRIPEDFYFSGDDIAGDAALGGLIALHFGCYGAGTTRLEDYAHRHGGAAKAVAPHDFIARLPQRLLAQSRGGALAMVAHVEQCWGYSYLGLEGGERLQTFESMLERLLRGHPIGSAMEYVNRRYAEVATMMSAELKLQKYGKKIDERKLVRLWTAENDARSYVVLGDPAVRLPVARS